MKKPSPNNKQIQKQHADSFEDSFKQIDIISDALSAPFVGIADKFYIQFGVDFQTIDDKLTPVLKNNHSNANLKIKMQYTNNE